MTSVEKAGLITFMIGLTGILGSVIRNVAGPFQITDIIVWLSCVVLGALIFCDGSAKE